MTKDAQEQFKVMAVLAAVALSFFLWHAHKKTATAVSVADSLPTDSPDDYSAPVSDVNPTATGDSVDLSSFFVTNDFWSTPQQGDSSSTAPATPKAQIAQASYTPISLGPLTLPNTENNAAME